MNKSVIRVLLIHGNEEDFLATQKGLKEFGGTRFQLEWVAGYGDGMEAIRRRRHDAYLIDSGLDAKGAIELTRAATRAGCLAPIILLTPPDDGNIELEAIHAGASDCLMRAQTNGALLGRVIVHAFERSVFASQLQDRDEFATRLAAIVESSDDAVISKTLDGVITSWNKSAERLFGYSAAESLGRYVTLIIPPDRAGEFKPLLARLAKGERIKPFDTIRIRKDGSRVPVSVSISPIRDREGRVIGASKTAHDITDRQRAQDQFIEQTHTENVLRETEAQFKLILDSTGEGIFGIDLNGYCTFCNPAAARLLGYQRPEDLLGKNMHKLAHHTRADGSPYPEEVCRIYESFRTGEGVRIEDEVFWRADGTSFYVECFSHPIRRQRTIVGSVVTFLDVTERRRTQLALEKSEARFRVLVEGSADGIVVTEDGVIREANRGFAEIFGLTLDEVIGRRAADFSTEETRDVTRLHIEGEVDGTYELVGKRKDGSRVVLDVTARTHDIGGRRERMASLRDVTEKRILEGQLRQAQKMEAVGRLAGGVAHDFNNLLTVITAYVGLLLEDVGPTDPRREDIGEIGKAAEAAADLTRQLLTFSRQQVIQPRIVVIEEIVANSQKMLTRLLGEDIDLVTTLAGGSTVKIDPGQLEQIIVNLAVNARDAMPTGGKITIETEIVNLDDEYARAHWPATPGRFAMLAVSDTGVGMDAETQARIFEPFFTTKEMGSGTGLGLATVYGIVKQSGGFIWVYSEPGQGAAFKVYLPIVNEAPSDADRVAPHQAPRGTETILLLEDSPAVRASVRESLKRYGYTVLEAAHGNVAIDIATKHRGPIDLLLTDVVMPAMSGRLVAEKLIPLRPQIKVLFMSGYAADAVVRQGVLGHGLAYLQKPFSPDTLARRVRDVLDAPRDS